MKRTGPDSLTSWMVVLLCSLISLLLYGVVRLSGVLLVASMSRFQVGRQSASFPYILCDSVQAVLGPVVGFLSLKFGLKPVILLGCFIASAGIGFCFFAEDIGMVTFLWGVIFGIGFGLISLLLPVLITQHFVKKRATAISIMYFGSYLGFSFLPPLTYYFINIYGLSGTFLLLGGLLLHAIPLAILLRKPEAKTLDEKSYQHQNSRNIAVITDPQLYKTADTNSNPSNVARSRTGSVVCILKCEINCSSCASCKQFQVDYDLKESDELNNDIHLSENVIAKQELKNDLQSVMNDDKSQNIANSSIIEVSSNAILEKELRKKEYYSSLENFNVASKVNFELNIKNRKNSCISNISKSSLNNRYYYSYKGNIEDSIKSSKDVSIVLSDFFIHRLWTQTWSPYATKSHLENLDMFPEHLKSQKKTTKEAFKIFLEPIFLLTLFVAGIYGSSFIAFITVIVDFAMDIGFSSSDGTLIIMIFSVASNIGLLSFGWVTDCGYLSLTNFAGLMFLCRSVTLLLVPYLSSFAAVTSTVAVQGFCEASLANLFPLIIADYYSESVHELAISCTLLFCGPLYLVTPPLIGFFRDTLGSYLYLFLLMGLLSLLCSVLLVTAPLLSKCRCVQDRDILRKKSLS